MLFHSYGYLLAFLPLVLVGYFALTRRRWIVAAKVWLALASVVFYGMWNLQFLPVLTGSILFNYGAGVYLTHAPSHPQPSRRLLLQAALAVNVGLLAFYKYMDFFIGATNSLLGGDWPLLHLLLPLGISFFTLTQITFLVDAYEGLVPQTNFLNYVLFVTFFPHLLMGPVLHHREMMPQFDNLRTKCWQPDNVRQGVILLVIGLAKKVLLADVFAVWVRQAYDVQTTLTFAETLCASAAYTFQLYFDFSGYTDMALGAALLFNVRLPVNFDSPFQAVNIIEFWQRWHISFTRFITTYIYTPLLLAASRIDSAAMIRTVFITMGIAGLWHEAGWTFLLFYLLHALALVLNHWWRKRKTPLPDWIGWPLTFSFLILSIAIIRIKTTVTAEKMLLGLTGSMGWGISPTSIFVEKKWWAYLCVALLVSLYGKNSQQLARSMPQSALNAVMVACLGLAALLGLNQMSEFLYFNF